LLEAAQSTAGELGLSVAETMRLALHLGLPLLRAQKAILTGTVAAVSPWQPGELAADYANETDEGFPIQELMAAQRWGA
jgi:hypothetical protein